MICGKGPGHAPRAVFRFKIAGRNFEVEMELKFWRRLTLGGAVSAEYFKPVKRSVFYDAMNIALHTDIRRLAILTGLR